MGLSRTQHLLVTGLLLAGALALDLGLPRRGPPPGHVRFRARGGQGEIAGEVRIEAGVIAEVRISESHEGIDRRALNDAGFLARFRGLRAHAPLPVDVVSGATVSSRALIDAVEHALGGAAP